MEPKNKLDNKYMKPGISLGDAGSISPQYINPSVISSGPTEPPPSLNSNIQPPVYNTQSLLNNQPGPTMAPPVAFPPGVSPKGVTQGNPNIQLLPDRPNNAPQSQVPPEIASMISGAPSTQAPQSIPGISGITQGQDPSQAQPQQNPAASPEEQDTPQELEQLQIAKSQAMQADPRLTGDPNQDLQIFESDISTPLNKMDPTVAGKLADMESKYQLSPSQVDKKNLPFNADDGGVYECPFSQTPCKRQSFWSRMGAFFRRLFGVDDKKTFISKLQAENVSDPIAYKYLAKQTLNDRGKPGHTPPPSINAATLGGQMAMPQMNQATQQASGPQFDANVAPQLDMGGPVNQSPMVQGFPMDNASAFTGIGGNPQGAQ